MSRVPPPPSHDPTRHTLFAQPRARATDPQTSHDAAARHAPQAGTNAAVILRVVRQCPGQTAVEIHSCYLPSEHIATINRHEVSRRLAGLERDGLVRKGDARKCRVKGTSMVTWWPEGQP